METTHGQGGYHVLATLIGIDESIVTTSASELRKRMEVMIVRCGFHVINECHHQFKPYGATAIYLLSESHFSAHTFYETNKIIFDIFCCSPAFDPIKTKTILQEVFGGVVSQFDVIER